MRRWMMAAALLLAACGSGADSAAAGSADRRERCRRGVASGGLCA